MKIHELYTNESKWTKRAEARNSEGDKTFFDDHEATCFCLFGALFKCYPDNKERRGIRLRIEARLNFVPITQWNDDPNRTFEEVKQLAVDLDI